MPPKKISGAKRKSAAGELIRKLRKPLAPPTKVKEDERKYRRERERARLRGEIPTP